MALGRKTGGRQPGSLNKSTVARIEAVEQLAEVLSLTEEDIDAHTLLKRVYRSPSMALQARMAAAQIAIRHEKPTLAQMKQASLSDGEVTSRIEVVYVDAEPVNDDGQG